MKGLKWGILALLAGEYLVMSKKDANFKKQLAKKQGRDKLKYIGERLFDFNKNLVDETKEKIETMDTQAEISRIKAFIEKEYDALHQTIETTSTKLESMKEKQLGEILQDIADRLSTLKEKTDSIQGSLDKKYGRKKKLKALQLKYDEIIEKKS